jgi:pilus assembly protein CpaF
MSLAERIAAAKRDRGVAEAGASGEALGGPPKRHRRIGDPFADLKRAVHQTLLDSLGPKLYDSRLTQADLEQKVRSTLQEVLAQDDTPLTVADRARIAQ